MKKGFVAITAAFALAATSLIGTSIAGIGPLRGLPDVNVSTTSATADMYAVNDTAVPGINGSVMCVACHTRNPAKRTAYGTTNGKGDAGYAGSHFVTANFADTSEGGGYTDNPAAAKARAARTATPVYMARSAAANFDWAGAPKYGTGSATSIDTNTIDPTAGAAAQMICESCHNIVTNIGAAKLLATGFANGGDNAAYTVPGTTQLHGIAANGGTTVPTLCIGCHGNMSAGVSAEWQLHPLYTGSAAWTGTHHHRNTGTVATDYFGSGTQTAGHDMGSMDRAYYSVALGLQMWGAAYGELGTTARVPTYDPATNKKMKLAPTTAPQGQIRVGAANQVLCTNCHRGHNAATAGGSTILMVTTTAAPVLGPTTAATALNGLGTSGRDAHINNTNPLCLGCHQ